MENATTKIPEYTKISNIFVRDPDTKKLTSDYARIEYKYLENCEWEFREKIDGTNIRVIWDGYRVSFRGRTDKASIPKHLLEKLEELFGGPNNEEIFEQQFGTKQVILFGEGYGEKIQKVGNLYGPVNFRLFDVMINGWWLNSYGIEGIADLFGIGTAPMLFFGTLHDGIKYVKTHPMSDLMNADHEIEGVVGRPTVQLFDKKGDPIMVKIKCRDFPAESEEKDD